MRTAVFRVGRIVAETERKQHVRRFDARRLTGRSGGQSDVREGRHERLALDTMETQVDNARNRASAIAVHRDLLDAPKPLQKTPLQVGGARRLAHAHDLMRRSPGSCPPP